MFSFLARSVLKKYKPAIVVIVGDFKVRVIKEAAGVVLASEFFVSKGLIKKKSDIFHFILKTESRSSVFKNFSNFLKALKLIFSKEKYPEVLISELSAKKPGDFNYLISFLSAYLRTVLISSEAISPEFLKNFQVTVKSLPADIQIILNYDEGASKKIAKADQIKALKFGLSEKADIQATDILFQVSQENTSFREKWESLDEIFTSFKVVYQGKTVPIRLLKTIGKSQVCAALGAISIGIAFRMNLLEISESLKKYRAPAGAMKILKGIKYTLIIDNTHNADLFSTIDGLENLSLFKETRKIAVLGDVLGLGSLIEEEHRKIGARVAENINLLFTVGARAKFIAGGAFEKGMDRSKIYEFFNSEKAGRMLQEKLKEGDIILVSGPEEMNMEKIVKEVMAEPGQVEEILSRQEKK